MSRMSSGLLRVVAGLKISSLGKSESHFVVGWTSLGLSVDGHSDGFHLSALANNAAISTNSLFTSLLSVPWGAYLEVGLVGHMESSI